MLSAKLISSLLLLFPALPVMVLASFYKHSRNMRPRMQSSFPVYERYSMQVLVCFFHEALS